MIRRWDGYATGRNTGVGLRLNELGGNLCLYSDVKDLLDLNKLLMDSLVLSRFALRELLDANAIRDHEGLSVDDWNDVIMQTEEGYDASGIPLDDVNPEEYAASVARVLVTLGRENG